MRKLVVFTALAALICGSGGAREGTEPRARRASPPATTGGEGVTATVTSRTRQGSRRRARPPTIRLINQLDQHREHASSTSPRVRPSTLGVYRARVVFPTAAAPGASSSSTAMTGRAYSFGRTSVRASSDQERARALVRTAARSCTGSPCETITRSNGSSSSARSAGTTRPSCHGSRPHAELALRGERVREHDRPLLGQPHRSLVATASVVERDEPAR